MLKKLKKYENQYDINLRVLFCILLFRVVSDQSIVEQINEILISVFGPILSFDLHSLYAYNPTIENFPLDRILPIFATLYLPPLIATYSNAIAVNSIWKLYVAKTFKVGSVFTLVFITIISQKSTSLFYIATILLVLAYGLIRTYLLFRAFLLFRNKQDLVAMLSSLIGKNFLPRKNYLQCVDKLGTTLSKLKKSGKLGEIENFDYLNTKAVKNLENADTNKFESWIDQIIASIRKIDIEATRGFGSTVAESKLALEQGKHMLDIDILRDDRNFGVSAFIKLPKGYILSEDVKSDLLTKLFLNVFSNVESLAKSDEDSFDEFIDGLDAHLISLLEQKKIDLFQSEIRLLEDLVKSFKNDSSISHKIMYLSYKVMNLFDASTLLVNNPMCKKAIYKFWLTLFEASLSSTNHAYVDQIFRTLTSAIRNKAFDQKDLKELEKDLSSALKYSEVSDEFLKGYVHALVDISQRTVALDKADISLHFMQLVSNIREDIKNEYILSGKENSKQLGVNLANQGCMIFSAYMLYKKHVDVFRKSIRFIDSDSFLETLEQLLRADELEWRPIWWDDNEFDRHGMGQTRTFDSSSFYSSFITEYLKLNPACNISNGKPLHYNFKYLLEIVYSNLEKDRPKNEPLIRAIRKAIDNSQIFEENEVIKSPLSDVRISKLIEVCYKEYVEHSAFRAFFSKETLTINSDKFVGGIGYNTTLPKDYFVESFNVVLSGLGQFGRGLAEGENKKLFSELITHYKSEGVKTAAFFEDVLPRYLSEDYLLFTNQHGWSERVFTWDGINKFNNKIRRKHEKDKLFYFIDNNKIDVAEFETGTKPETIYYALISRADLPKIQYQIPQNDFCTKDVLFYKISHYAQEDLAMQELLSSESYFSGLDVSVDMREHYLKTKIGFQIYINPTLDISQIEKIVIFEML